MPLLSARSILSFLVLKSTTSGVRSFAVPSASTPLFGISTKSTVLFSSTSTTMPEVKPGDTLADVTLKELKTGDDKPSDVKLLSLLAGKKVALFGVPGAFTPGCSKSHLPSFIDAQSQLKDKGVDMIICVATNDPYVMEAWGRTSGGADAGIRFLADDAGELTEQLGLVMTGGPALMRMKRFSLIAEDGKVTHYFSSAKQASDTWAPAVLSSL